MIVVVVVVVEVSEAREAASFISQWRRALVKAR